MLSIFFHQKNRQHLKKIIDGENEKKQLKIPRTGGTCAQVFMKLKTCYFSVDLKQ